MLKCGFNKNFFKKKILVFFSKSNFVSTRKCYYKILNLDSSASNEDIKAAYYKLAKKFHPDNDPNSEENQIVYFYFIKIKFREISEAYEILKDEVKRTEYNKAIFGESGFTAKSFTNQDKYDHFSSFNINNENNNKFTADPIE